MLSVIKQIKSVKESLSFFKHDTHQTMLLVLDLDNTTMQSSKDLGGDQWFNAILAHVTKHVGNFEVALESVLLVYNAVQHHIKSEAVEPGIVYIIRALQALGVPVLGLTARNLRILEPTLRQLHDIGIDFSKNLVQPEVYDRYAQGIIFCDGANKGDALAAFLSRVEHSLTHVVMLDDKESHLKHVAVAMKKLNIQFTGLRYGFLDAKVEDFKMHEANVQLAHLIEYLPPSIKKQIEGFQLIAPENVDEAKATQALAGHFFHPVPHAPSAIVEVEGLSPGSRPRRASF